MTSKIKVLGSGSKGNCYVIDACEEILILECGIPYKKILQGLNFNLKCVVGCLCTHHHKDHIKSIKDMIGNSIKVYGPEEVFTTSNLEKNRKCNVVKTGDLFEVGGFKVKAFDTKHCDNDERECESLGYLIQHKDIGKIVFITDTYYLKYKFSNVDHVLIECNYQESAITDLPAYRRRVLKSHMSLETLKDALKTWDLKGTKDITLIHLSELNSNAEVFKREVESLTGIKTYIAEEGLEWMLKC